MRTQVFFPLNTIEWYSYEASQKVTLYLHRRYLTVYYEANEPIKQNSQILDSGHFASRQFKYFVTGVQEF